MLYCSKQGLIDRFSLNELIQLTDRDSLGIINDDVLNRAIEDASTEMDAYLSRFNFTADTLPKSLKPLACDIARYRLYDEAPTEHVTNRYNNAIKFLKAVNKGEITIGTNSQDSEVATTDLAEMQSAGSVFSRDNSTSFI
jgi:phage gp36-like protein